jgi:translation elongation factor EF-Tu-like GTPase
MIAAMSGGALLTIEEAFVVPGRGLAVTGRLRDGDLDVGDRLWLLGDGIREMLTVRRLDRDGDDVALLLDGAAQDMVRPGLVLAADGRL